jgi:hypothetical protein
MTPEPRAESTPPLAAGYLAPVPDVVRRNVDRALFETPDEELDVAKIHRKFGLENLFDVSLPTFRRYVHRLFRNKKLHHLADSSAADLGPTPDPDEVERLEGQVQLLVLKNLARTLDGTDLLPAEICSITRVFIAYRNMQVELSKLDDDALPSDEAFAPLEHRVQFLILRQLVRTLEDADSTPAETCSMTRVFVAFRRLQLPSQSLTATATETEDGGNKPNAGRPTPSRAGRRKRGTKPGSQVRDAPSPSAE